MSEVINTKNNRNDLRWALLTTVSALALFLPVGGGGQAQAADDDTDHHTVWIELGGQLERMNDDSERFAPPFVAGITALGFTSPVSIAHMPRWGIGGDGKVSFTPDDTDWIFSVAIRYGRSQNVRHTHQSDARLTNTFHYSFSGQPHSIVQIANEADLADTQVDNREAHVILDFQAGRDVGLGKFGSHGDSTFAAGLRFAQLTSHSNIEMGSDQNVGFGNILHIGTQALVIQSHYNAYAATLAAARSFRGLGPSLSWNASAVAAGTEESEITFDWGVNAAILFGRQKANIHHHSTAAYKSNYGFLGFQSHFAVTVNSTHFAPPDQKRARTVMVPNVGGFAGVSFRHGAAKVDFGYRADFFFGAMDGGIDTRKSETTGFYGPFASISVGLGG